jgi:hypothetical protein
LKILVSMNYHKHKKNLDNNISKPHEWKQV